MKSILDVILGAVPALGGLREALIEAKELLQRVETPESRAVIAELDKQIKALETIPNPLMLLELALRVVQELKALPISGLNPVSRPGDLTGG